MTGLRAAALAAAILVPGCIGSPRDTPPPAAAPPDIAELRLVEAAVRAEAALAALARIRSGAAPKEPAPAPRVVPPALLRRITLDWIGPLEALAGKLAGFAGYRFGTAGATPARPVIVVVGGQSRRLIDLLRDAGLQAGAHALLTVDADRLQVRLDWLPPSKTAS